MIISTNSADRFSWKYLKKQQHCYNLHKLFREAGTG